MTWQEAKDIIIVGAPVLAYLVILERRLTAMATDIKWIKREVKQCLPPLEDHTV